MSELINHHEIRKINEVSVGLCLNIVATHQLTRTWLVMYSYWFLKQLMIYKINTETISITSQGDCVATNSMFLICIQYMTFHVQGYGSVVVIFSMDKT